jgi:hypothetical protein
MYLAAVKHEGTPLISDSPTFPSRAIPLTAILLIALAAHGPLLLMQLPTGSYDANSHIFFAAHYAHHWFNPWNVNWFGGFSQTTYPPLTHQWIALFSHVMGLEMAYMFVQFLAILLLPIGMYRYTALWVDEVSASYAALGSVFLGSLAMLVYQSGQLPTTAAAALILNALPFFYTWLRRGRFTALLKGVAIGWAAAAAHHVTLLFGAIFLATPVFVLAILDRDRDDAPDERGAEPSSRQQHGGRRRGPDVAFPFRRADGQRHESRGAHHHPFDDRLSAEGEHWNLLPDRQTKHDLFKPADPEAP